MSSNQNQFKIILGPYKGGAKGTQEFRIAEAKNDDRFSATSCGPNIINKYVECKLLFTTPLGREIYREVNIYNNDIVSGEVFVKINSTIVTIYPSPPTDRLQNYVDSFLEVPIESVKIRPQDHLPLL